jgi:putative transcriptional regulator
MKDMLKNSVAEHRQKSGTTQESLANAVGVTRQTIIAIEKGNYAPSVLLALKIAAFFDKPLEKIFYVER